MFNSVETFVALENIREYFHYEFAYDIPPYAEYGKIYHFQIVSYIVNPQHSYGHYRTWPKWMSEVTSSFVTMVTGLPHSDNSSPTDRIIAYLFSIVTGFAWLQ